MEKAIKFDFDSSRLVTIEYGESDFKKVDNEFIYFWKDGKKNGPYWAAFVRKDTELNRKIIIEIQDSYKDLKAIRDATESNLYKLLNNLEK